MNDKTYQVKLRWLILVSTIVRCIIANLLELGNDEVYYYTYAQQLDWNHFDHPPLIGIFIRFFTLNLNWVNDFTMRLGPIVLAAFNTWCIATITKQIATPKAGYIVAILYCSSFYASIISGILILPDSFANSFWLLAIYSMVTLIKSKERNQINNHLLLLGCWIGLASLCKVHALVLAVGFVVFAFFHRKDFFRNIYFYAGIVICLILISPILFWNIQHEWINYHFHGERVNLSFQGLRLDFFLQSILGQFFYNNPFLIILYAIALFQVVKYKCFKNPFNTQFLILTWYCTLPLLIYITFISLIKQTLPHWTGSLFFFYMIITATWAERQIDLGKTKFVRIILNNVMPFTLIMTISLLLIIRFYPGNVTGTKEQLKLGNEDISLEMIGWRKFGEEFKIWRDEQIESGHMKPTDPILVHKWFPAGHIGFYISRPLGIRMIAEGKLKDLHKYAWMNLLEEPIQIDEDAYYISPSNIYTDPNVIYPGLFKEIRLIKTFEQTRSHVLVRRWYIYQLISSNEELGNKKPWQYHNN